MNFVVRTSLFLLRNSYFIIGTALLSDQNRARSASGMSTAPSKAGGEKSKESSSTEVGALFFV
jgi:hypothetical protein